MLSDAPIGVASRRDGLIFLVIAASLATIGHLTGRVGALESERQALAAMQKQVDQLTGKLESERSHGDQLKARLEAMQRQIDQQVGLQKQVDIIQQVAMTPMGQPTGGSAPPDLTGRLITLEQSVAALVSQSSNAPARRLSSNTAMASADDSLATIRVDAPHGTSEVVLGGESAVDNVIMSKAHLSSGGAFTIRRNDTDVMRIGVDGALSVLSDPLQVASTVSSAPGAELELRSNNGVVLQNQRGTTVTEVHGASTWSQTNVLVYTGDTVTWSWTDLHNVVQIDDSGVIVAGGIRSGELETAGTYTHQFREVGTFKFKCQNVEMMRITVEVRELWAVRNSTQILRGDLQVGGSDASGEYGTLTVGDSLIAGPGMAGEIRMFLQTDCPSGWTEATELGGYFLMGRSAGGQVNVTKNRPMDASEDGRMHSTYFKGSQRFTGGRVSNAICTGESDYSADSYTCDRCKLPDGSKTDCDAFGGGYDIADYFYKVTSGASVVRSWNYLWDRLSHPSYQTAQYMGPIGEYYPFASILICKRSGA